MKAKAASKCCHSIWLKSKFIFECIHIHSFCELLVIRGIAYPSIIDLFLCNQTKAIDRLQLYVIHMLTSKIVKWTILHLLRCFFKTEKCMSLDGLSYCYLKFHVVSYHIHSNVEFDRCLSSAHNMHGFDSIISWNNNDSSSFTVSTLAWSDCKWFNLFFSVCSLVIRLKAKLALKIKCRWNICTMAFQSVVNGEWTTVRTCTQAICWPCSSLKL